MTVTAGFTGAQTDGLRAFGKRLAAGADTLVRIRSHTDRQIRELDWLGRDSGQFQSTWVTRYAPALDQVAAALRSAAVDVAAQADHQDSVSGAGGAGSAAAGTTGGNTGGTAGVTADSTAGSGTDPGGAEGTTGAGDRLGELSAKHESNGDSGTVSSGRGDHGGVSYGKFQIATETGTAAEYVKWLETSNPGFYERFDGLQAGSAEFKSAWQELNAEDPDAFAESQYQFILQTHFEPAMDETYSRVPGFSLEGRSPVVAEMMFSTTVQHRFATDTIVARALEGKDVAALSDAEIITAIYDERGAGDGSKYFPSSSENVQQNVAARFRREKAEALAALGN